MIEFNCNLASLPNTFPIKQQNDCLYFSLPKSLPFGNIKQHSKYLNGLLYIENYFLPNYLGIYSSDSPMKDFQLYFWDFYSNMSNLTVYYILTPKKGTAGLFMHISKCQFP